MPTYTLVLTQEQLNILGAGLGELPFKVSAPVAQEINRQIAEAMKPAETPVNDPPTKD
ncbi:MAG: hypothetical protein P4L10_11205 [Acidobacteriaceae bacterium]|nr:hypothetical protein [Acidobacteriaceae bacterium]